MPFRLNEFRTKIQFITFAAMPSLITRAAFSTEQPSNTVYIQHAVCEALSRDLDIPLQELLDLLPAPETNAKHLSLPPDSPLVRLTPLREGRE